MLRLFLVQFQPSLYLLDAHIQPVQAPTLRSAERVQVADLVAADILPLHPEDVTVAVQEIVLDPDVEDGDPTGALIFHIRMPGDINPKEVTVPADYLASLPADTPVKIEVGAIGLEDNATFLKSKRVIGNFSPHSRR